MSPLPTALLLILVPIMARPMASEKTKMKCAVKLPANSSAHAGGGGTKHLRALGPPLVPFAYNCAARVAATVLAEPAGPGGGGGASTYVLVVVGDSLLVLRAPSDSELSGGAEPQALEQVKLVRFAKARPTAVAVEPVGADGTDDADVLVGLSTGAVMLLGLRTQLQHCDDDAAHAAKPFFAAALSSFAARSAVTSVAWCPRGKPALVSAASTAASGTASDGSSSPEATARLFVSAHADGSLHVVDAIRDGANTDPLYDPLTDGERVVSRTARPPPSSANGPSLFTMRVVQGRGGVACAYRYRWRVCDVAVRHVCLSPDGSRLAAACDDGVLRIFDFTDARYIGGCRGYHGAVLCCSFDRTGEIVALGCEDDGVYLYSIAARAVVAAATGVHRAWVSAVAFEDCLDEDDGNDAIRFASVAQDGSLAVWEHMPTASSPPLDNVSSDRGARAPFHPYPSYGSLSASYAEETLVCRTSSLLDAPPLRLISGITTPGTCATGPKRVGLRVHSEPLSDVAFYGGAMVTADVTGCVKLWR